MGHFNSDWINPFCKGKTIKQVEQDRHGYVSFHFTDGSKLRFHAHSRYPDKPPVTEVVVNPYDAKGEVVSSIRIAARAVPLTERVLSIIKSNKFGVSAFDVHMHFLKFHPEEDIKIEQVYGAIQGLKKRRMLIKLAKCNWKATIRAYVGDHARCCKYTNRHQTEYPS